MPKQNCLSLPFSSFELMRRFGLTSVGGFLAKSAPWPRHDRTSGSERRGFERPSSRRTISVCSMANDRCRARSGDKGDARQRLGGKPFVAMMQATDLREGDDLAGVRRMNQAWFRAVLLKRQVSSRSMVVVKIR